MPTTDDCMRCTKPCPQAKLAHETAKGRMYATNELLSYVKKVESGQLVEVVRCKDCKQAMLWRKPADKVIGECFIRKMNSEDEQFCMVGADDFCSYGERKESG